MKIVIKVQGVTGHDKLSLDLCIEGKAPTFELNQLWPYYSGMFSEIGSKPEPYSRGQDHERYRLTISRQHTQDQTKNLEAFADKILEANQKLFETYPAVDFELVVKG